MHKLSKKCNFISKYLLLSDMGCSFFHCQYFTLINATRAESLVCPWNSLVGQWMTMTQELGFSSPELSHTLPIDRASTEQWRCALLIPNHLQTSHSHDAPQTEMVIADVLMITEINLIGLRISLS